MHKPQPRELTPEEEERVISTSELHSLTTRTVREAHGDVFGSLPSLIRQIIKRKVWLSMGHKSFADYALCESSSGLRINNNQRLWVLRSAMDVHGAHMAEWGEVLIEVEERVRAWAKANGKAVGSRSEFNGNSLEDLAKNGSTSAPMTYLPSRQRGAPGHATDGNLVRLHRRDPAVFRRVVTGKLSLIEGRKAAGLRVDNASHLQKAKSAIRHMDAEQRSELVAWMRAEGWVKP